MALKPRYKRRIFWSVICTIATILLAGIILPSMITLNSFKNIIEKSVYEQTNVPLQLHGDIHFSLAGGATIVAHDVIIPDAKIGSVLFSIPFHSLFNIKNAKLNDAVVIYDADINVKNLSPAMFNHNIKIYNSNIDFMGNKFHIIRADFTDGQFHGTIRSAKHKYDVEFIGNTFNIKNKTNKLDVTGQFYSDGSIRGHLEVETKDIGKWIGFDNIRNKQPIKISTNFEWDGGTGYKFTNIDADNIAGSITIYPDGKKEINLVSTDTAFDFSFLTQPNKITNETKLNLDFYGDLTFGNRTFNHIKINVIATPDKLQIVNVIADDISITGGEITNNGAQNIMITMPINNTSTMCIFSGTPEKWNCSEFTYGNLYGSLYINNDAFEINIKSNQPMPDNQELLNMAYKFGTHGTIKFTFTNIGGTYHITKQGITPQYDFAKNKTLNWLKINIPFIPDFIKNTPGDFIWQKNTLVFTPHNKTWELSVYDNYFYITGNSFKAWLPNLDLRFINDDKYIISGYYNADKISNLKISVSGHEFTGSVSGKNVTLHTNLLNLDTILNKSYLNNFSELEFLTNDPVLTLFDIPLNISLSAGGLSYNNNTYKNFTYSLKQNSQTFSITDASRGNILATIDKDKTNYEIFAQLNQFLINGYLLSKKLPLNIRDTMITGELNFTTNGKIAHDIYYNMSGTVDLTFNNGYLIGMSFDDFYASAENITSLNAEYALSNALGGGETKLKQLQLIGKYDNGNFITTKPLTLSMRHTNCIGGLAITDGQMTAELDLTLRGTAPTPVTIELSIMPDNERKYSLSEIMQNLDTGFMRAFVKTHNKF